MTMTENQEQKWENMTLKSLEAKLRLLREVEVPQTLEAKIFAKIPDSNVRITQDHQVQRWYRVLGFGIAAAAVLIFASVIVSNYGSSVSSPTLITDLNNRPARYVLTDQNTPLIADINFANGNSQ